MASLSSLDPAVPGKPIARKKHHETERETYKGAVDLVSIGERTLNFSNRNQTVDNDGIESPLHHELLTRLPLGWGFVVDVDRLDERATLKIGIYVPQDCRVCPMMWNHDIDPKMLHGTVWYWNLTDVRKRAICKMASPSSVRFNYGNGRDVKWGSSVGVYKDSNGSLHFVVDNKDQGIAVEKIPRNVFYGWLRIGNTGTVKITHRVDLALANYVQHELSKGLPRQESKPQKPSTTKQSKETNKKKKEQEKMPPQSTQQKSDPHASASSTKTEERKEKSKPLHTYRMTKTPRGYCLIISNSKFHDNSRNRQGADIDEKAIKSLFEELHFTVAIKKNQTAQEMESLLYEYARKGHGDFDAFVCVIMTHGGDNNILLGVDDRKIKLEDLMSAVKPNNCRSLQGKPKMFFVQACRGDFREDVATSYCPSSVASNYSTYRDGHMFDVDGLSTLSTDSALPRSLCPVEGDFLLACATTPGYVALRDRKEGSIFVQVLVDVFREHHRDYHVLELLTEVNRRVTDRVEELTDGTYWQVPGPSFTLRANLYL